MATAHKKTPRIDILDGLRGLLLVIMTIDHMILWPLRSLSGYLHFIYQPLGFVSAAEGFYFLSGMVVALAYGSRMDRDGTRAYSAPILRRALKLYLVNFFITAFVIFTIQSRLEVSYWPIFLTQEYVADRWWAILLAAGFVNPPWLCDILIVYVIFLPLTILVSWASKKINLFWIILASIGFWTLGQIYPLDHLARFLDIKLPSHQFTFGWFEIASWQLVFLGGFLVGSAYRLERIPLWLKNPPRSLMIFVSGTVLVFALQRHGYYIFDDKFVHHWSMVRSVGPIRLFNFIVLAYTIFCFRRFLSPLLKLKWLTLLGTESLPVFVYHIVAVYATAVWAQQTGAFQPAAAGMVLGATILGTFVVALASKKIDEASPKPAPTKILPAFL